MTENTTAVDQQSETLIGWAASNIVALNDCQAGSWWSLVINIQGSNDAAYNHNVSSNECSALVNGWVLGTTMSGSCESTSVAQKETTSGNTSSNEEIKDQEQSGPSQAELDEQKKQEELAKQEAAEKEALASLSNSISELKNKFTSCHGSCKEEHEAWKNAVEACKATYGEAKCSANGIKE